MEELDVKQLEDLKALLTPKWDSGKREKDNGKNIMTFVAIISTLLGLGGFLFAFISGRVDPISQQLSYSQSQQLELDHSLGELVKTDTEALKNRAALEEKFENVKNDVLEVKEWKNWWFEEIYPMLIDSEARLKTQEDMVSRIMKDLHSPVVSKEVKSCQ